jgi:hypothetical protein
LDSQKVYLNEGERTWHFKLGTEIRVLVKMVAVKDRFHVFFLENPLIQSFINIFSRYSVVLVDYIPAGTQIILPEVVPQIEINGGGQHTKFWYDSKHLLGNRVEAHQSGQLYKVTKLFKFVA